MPHPLAWFVPGRRIEVRNKMQRGYSYVLSARAGRDFDPRFTPALTPAQMLALGVFEGAYLRDCAEEYPREWFAGARFARGPPDPGVNHFGVKSRLSLGEWRRRGWIVGDDPRGHFEWYCRYWLGRRDPATDEVQIRRWRSFARHAGQIRASVARLPPAQRPRTRAQKREHRPRQRQALLQWAYDPYL